MLFVKCTNLKDFGNPFGPLSPNRSAVSGWLGRLLALHAFLVGDEYKVFGVKLFLSHCQDLDCQ